MVPAISCVLLVSGGHLLGYFKPLRRRLGVVTLLMACACMSLWIKTYFSDREWCLQVPRFPVLHHFWIARRGFGWRGQELSNDSKSSLDFKSRWIVSIIAPSNLTSPPRLKGDVIGGFRFDEDTTQLPTGGRYITRIWLFPYWSVVTPLTVLSACLLLSKPRPLKANGAT